MLEDREPRRVEGEHAVRGPEPGEVEHAHADVSEGVQRFALAGQEPGHVPAYQAAGRAIIFLDAYF